MDVYEAEAKALFGDVPPPAEEFVPVAQNEEPVIPAPAVKEPIETPRPRASIPTDFPAPAQETATVAAP